MNQAPSNQQICHAYRHLYRGLLHAVQYSKPARYVARDTLRTAFRKEDPSSFDQNRVDTTVMFLKFAAKEKGMEHRIIKSMLHTKFCENEENKYQRYEARDPVRQHLKNTTRNHYNMTITMLNKSMGLCLR